MTAYCVIVINLLLLLLQFCAYSGSVTPTPTLVRTSSIQSAVTSLVSGVLQNPVATTDTIPEPGKSSLEPSPTALGITTPEDETTTGATSTLRTDAAAASSAIPVYVWPIVILLIVAVLVSIVLAIFIFLKTKKSKYVEIDNN